MRASAAKHTLCLWGLPQKAFHHLSCLLARTRAEMCFSTKGSGSAVLGSCDPMYLKKGRMK